MFGSINMNIFTVIIQVWLGNECVQKQQMQAPQVMLEAQFTQLVQQLAQENRPMSCKMTLETQIWDSFENKTKTIENYVEFLNNKMCDFKGI